MPASLLSTTRNKNHRHICLLMEDNKVFVGKNNGHVHEYEVIYEPHSIDPETQDQIVKARVVLKGSHTHFLTSELIYNGKKDEKKDDKEYQNMVDAMIAESTSYENTFFRPYARIADNFRTFEQWDQNITNNLPDNRAAITIGLLNSRIDTLLGELNDIQTEPTVFPWENGDKKAADLFREIIKHILETNDFQFVKNEVTDDQVSLGRGLYDIAVDYTGYYQGNIKIDKFEWDHGFMGPHNKKDGSDAKHCEKIKIMDIEEAKNLWPDKADDIETGSALAKDYNYYINGSAPNDIDAEPSQFFNSMPYDAKNNKVRVVECQYYENKRISFVFNASIGLYQELNNISDDDLKQIKTLPYISIGQKPHNQVRILLFVGDVLAANSISEFDELGLVPVYGKKYKNKTFGKFFENLDTQRNVNKNFSFIIDAMLNSLNQATFIDEETFDGSEDEEQRFMKEGTSPGYVGKISKMDNKPERIEATPYPAGHERALQLSKDTMGETTNINEALTGSGSGYESAMAIFRRKQQALQGNAYFVHNSYNSIKRITRMLIKAIPKIYTPERCFRILDNRHQQQKFMKVGGEDWSTFTYDDIKEILSNTDAAQYDLVISENPYSPSKRRASFQIWMERYAQTGQIPIEWFIYLDPDLTEEDREKFKEYQSQQSESAQKSEINKIETQGKFNLMLEDMKQKGAAGINQQPGRQAEVLSGSEMVPQTG